MIKYQDLTSVSECEDKKSSDGKVRRLFRKEKKKTPIEKKYNHSLSLTYLQQIFFNIYI